MEETEIVNIEEETKSQMKISTWLGRQEKKEENKEEKLTKKNTPVRKKVGKLTKKEIQEMRKTNRKISEMLETTPTTSRRTVSLEDKLVKKASLKRKILEWKERKMDLKQGQNSAENKSTLAADCSAPRSPILIWSTPVAASGAQLHLELYPLRPV